MDWQKHLNLLKLGSDTTTEIDFEVKRVPIYRYKEVKNEKSKIKQGS